MLRNLRPRALASKASTIDIKRLFYYISYQQNSLESSLMKSTKFSGAFQVLVGTGMIGIWILNFLGGEIPELQSEPWSISMHILAEVVTAILLLISGLSILLKGRKMSRLYYLAFGALIYTLIASPGYFAQLSNWVAVALFLIMLIITLIFLLTDRTRMPVSLILLILLSSSCKNKSYLESQGELSILHLKGSPYERGQAHGLLLKEEINETISAWRQEVESEFSVEFDTVVSRFFSATSFQSDLKKSHPDLIREVLGLSQGAGLPFTTMLAFQLSEEMFTLLDQQARLHCTAIGIAKTDSTPTLLAQNMDPPPFLHGHAFVMHIIPKKNESESFVFTVPGLLGMTGLNKKGVGITCMSISMLNHAQSGVPVVAVVRDILRQVDLESAAAYLKSSSFAIPQCYTIGGPDGVRCFEVSANEQAEFYPFEEHNIVLHSNYSVHNRDFNPNYIKLLARYGKTTDDPYFCPRFFHAYDEIEACSRKLDADRIGKILRLPEPELESILNENTLGSLVMELDADPLLHIALGHQEGAKFHTLTFQ